ncbi:MAG: CsgG/HfaB family protein [Gemmatimonas sp.]|jgi:TolB-like protein|uniref:CsgG/HfaB family protein n=1 Tax=Gemmatimonas sp. TaxID=1962908 RepID=UPI00391F7606
MPTLLLLWLTALGFVPSAVGAADPPARKTVAVLNFDNNTGKADYDHLGQGMAAMMTTDLAAVDDIQLLERQRLADVTKEIDAQRSRYFDSTTAVRVGRLAGAQYIVIGSLAAVDPQIRIDTRIVRVETGAIVKSAKVTGKQEDFFDLQKRLTRQLVKDLDIALSPEDEAKLEARQQSNRVDELEAMVRLSNAMNLADVGDYGAATLKIAPVVAQYPNSTFVKLTADEIKRRASRNTEQKAKEKINGGVNKLIKKKWPPAA